MIAPRPRPLRAQDGAVLITSLILLLVMTMLAVTTMRTTTMEQKMAANAAFTNRAFQAAESALAEAVYSTDDTVLTNALNSGPSSVTTDGLSSEITSSAVVTYQEMDNAPCPGGSMGVGRGGTFENVYFRVAAQGGLQSGGDSLAESAVEAGISYCVPGS